MKKQITQVIKNYLSLYLCISSDYKIEKQMYEKVWNVKELYHSPSYPTFFL